MNTNNKTIQKRAYLLTLFSILLTSDVSASSVILPNGNYELKENELFENGLDGNESDGNESDKNGSNEVVVAENKYIRQHQKTWGDGATVYGVVDGVVPGNGPEARSHDEEAFNKIKKIKIAQIKFPNCKDSSLFKNQLIQSNRRRFMKAIFENTYVLKDRFKAINECIKTKKRYYKKINGVRRRLTFTTLWDVLQTVYGYRFDYSDKSNDPDDLFKDITKASPKNYKKAKIQNKIGALKKCAEGFSNYQKARSEIGSYVEVHDDKINNRGTIYKNFHYFSKKEVLYKEFNYVTFQIVNQIIKKHFTENKSLIAAFILQEDWKETITELLPDYVEIFEDGMKECIGVEDAKTWAENFKEEKKKTNKTMTLSQHVTKGSIAIEAKDFYEELYGDKLNDNDPELQALQNDVLEDQKKEESNKMTLEVEEDSKYVTLPVALLTAALGSSVVYNYVSNPSKNDDAGDNNDDYDDYNDEF